MKQSNVFMYEYLCFYIYTCIYVYIHVYTLTHTKVPEENNGGTTENILEGIKA